MAKPTLSDIRGASKSLLTSSDFVLSLGVVPGNGFSKSKDVQLKCISVSLPKVEIETIETNIRGFKRIDRGIKKFSDNTFSCDFYVSGGGGLLSENGDSYQFVYNWMQFIADTTTGSGQSGKKKFFTAATGNALFDNNKWVNSINPNVANNGKSAYALDDVTVNIYNTSGDLALRVSLYGVFPTLLEGLDFENNTVEKRLLKVRATFVFDYMEINDAITTQALNFANKAVSKLTSKIPTPPRDFAKKSSKLF